MNSLLVNVNIQLLNAMEQEFIMYYIQKFDVNSEKNSWMNYLFLSLTHLLFISAYLKAIQDKNSVA